MKRTFHACKSELLYQQITQKGSQSYKRVCYIKVSTKSHENTFCSQSEKVQKHFMSGFIQAASGQFYTVYTKEETLKTTTLLHVQQDLHHLHFNIYILNYFFLTL